MLTRQQNAPNVSHVFQLVNVATGVTVAFRRVDQVCPRHRAKENMQKIRDYLEGTTGGNPLHWQHLGTGTPEEMAILLDTIKAGYPGID